MDYKHAAHYASFVLNIHNVHLQKNDKDTSTVGNLTHDKYFDRPVFLLLCLQMVTNTSLFSPIDFLDNVFFLCDVSI